jgi:hypothetical protein
VLGDCAASLQVSQIVWYSGLPYQSPARSSSEVSCNRCTPMLPSPLHNSEVKGRGVESNW